MAEEELPELPQTEWTVASARAYIEEHFVRKTFKKAALYFTLTTWEIKALEETEGGHLDIRNFRLFSEGEDDEAIAWWDGKQSPIRTAKPEQITQFVDEARAFLVAKAQADEIKAGELIYADNNMERATATIVDVTGQEKRVVLKKNAEKSIEMEEYTPLLTTDTAKTT